MNGVDFLSPIRTEEDETPPQVGKFTPSPRKEMHSALIPDLYEVYTSLLEKTPLKVELNSEGKRFCTPDVLLTHKIIDDYLIL